MATKNGITGSLVLTRRPGQVICLGDDVLIEVAEVKGERVRLKITAPRSLVIDRREVRERPGYVRNDP